MNTAYWLNRLWAGKCRREARRFLAATRSVWQVQSALLRDMLAVNRHSEFGMAHGFDGIHSVCDYRRRVPASSYEDYQSAIERIAAGRPAVLTRQAVRLLEPTSGSTGGEKLIPYTSLLRRQFQRAIDAWVHDLLTHRPRLRGGRAYWSVSPCLGERVTTQGGIPVGFDDDVAYLSRWERWAVRRLLAVPTHVSKLTNIDNFRYATLLHLLSATDLTLISVWSPTFLTALVAPLPEWIERICDDLRRGSISWPVPHTAPVQWRGTCSPFPCPTIPRRAELLRAAWSNATATADFASEVWPQLQLISCWCDAAAGQYLPQLQAVFPQTEIQPKGLLATEACVSFPMCDHPGAALAIRSHFFEFEETDNTLGGQWPRTVLAHEVEVGARYRLYVTTGGGLYRYGLGDQVEVVGFLHECPLIRLVGRLDSVADLCGEKLAELHVQDVLKRAFHELQITPDFAMLVPHTQPVPRYRLLVQLPSAASAQGRLECLRRLVESGLMENPYYRHAVEMKQLAPLEIERLSSGATSHLEAYEDFCRSRGQKAGDVKPTLLAPADWQPRVKLQMAKEV